MISSDSQALSTSTRWRVDGARVTPLKKGRDAQRASGESDPLEDREHEPAARDHPAVRAHRDPILERSDPHADRHTKSFPLSDDLGSADREIDTQRLLSRLVLCPSDELGGPAVFQCLNYSDGPTQAQRKSHGHPRYTRACIPMRGESCAEFVAGTSGVAMTTQMFHHHKPKKRVPL
jgi:hypothetical protein